jgi:glycosyltransferase involved in cell wall biosynthesis
LIRIAIDIQALQTEDSKDRGRGQYLLHLVPRILELDKRNQYTLVVNANLPLPEMVGWPPHRVLKFRGPSGRHRFSEALAFVSLLSNRVDVFHIGSPLEEGNAIIPQFKRFRPFKVVCALYDLIPYLFYEHYLAENGPFRSIYEYRLTNVRQADLILAISKHTRDDAIKHLRLPPEKVISVGSGVDPFFKSFVVDRQKWERALREKFGIDRKFLFYTGGTDWRKNITGLIESFARLPPIIRSEYLLVITCSLSDGELKQYRGAATKCGVDKAVILTNFVSQEELAALYTLCTVFVFPSLYEGFGLPIAEAMCCGAPVIAGNSSSLPEVVGGAGILADAASAEELSAAMLSLLRDEKLRLEMSERSLKRSVDFSWENVARRVVSAYESIGKKSRPNFNFRPTESQTQR